MQALSLHFFFSSRTHDMEGRHLPAPMEPSETCIIHPFALIRWIISLTLVPDGLTMILMASLWAHRNWFLDLLSLLVEDPRQLPLFLNLLVQPHFWKFHQGLNISGFLPGSWWMICPKGKLFNRGCYSNSNTLQEVFSLCVPGEVVYLLPLVP